MPSGDTSRVRRIGKTEFCGVFSERIREPKKAGRSGGDFFCIICGSSFTRVEGVNYHFPGCVRRFGNPDANSWYDHPSCSSASETARTRERGAAAGPSHRAQEPPVKRVKMMLRSSVPVGPKPTVPQTREPRHSQPSHSASTRSRRTVQEPTASEQPPRPTPKARGAPKPAKGQLVLAAKDKGKREKGSKEATHASGTKFHLDESQPPLSKLPAIFHDMVVNAWNKTPLKEAMDVLSERQIHVATMCSGTESPLLALDIIKEGKLTR